MVADDKTEMCSCVNVNHPRVCNNRAEKVCMSCARVFCNCCSEVHHKCDIAGVRYGPLR